jgi:hypothetical protein
MMVMILCSLRPFCYYLNSSPSPFLLHAAEEELHEHVIVFFAEFDTVVVDGGGSDEVVDFGQVLTHGFAVVAGDEAGVGEQGFAAFEVDETGRAVEIKVEFLLIEQVEDGDVVSVFLNDKKVIDHLYLTLRPREFEVELPTGREHYITVFADDFGKAEPNTATVEIFDGIKTYTIDLVSTRSEQESLKLVLE